MKDIRQIEAGTFAVVDEQGRVYRVTRAGSKFLVNGKAAELVIENPRDRKRGGASGAGSGRRDVKAAMPGKVVRVLVSAGDTVEAGQGLLILEAMKMQNELRSPGAGKVAVVKAAEGETVAAGQVLVTLE